MNLNLNKVKSELDKAWNPDSQAESTSGKETAKEIKETEVWGMIIFHKRIN